MATMYHSIERTLLMKEILVWRFLRDFFEEFLTGGEVHLSCLELAVMQ